MKFAFFNDHFCLQKDLYIHSSDLAIHRGYGVFDFLKLKGGNNPWIEWYIERFYSSIQQAHLVIPHSPPELVNIINTLILKNQSPDSCVKMLATGGYSDNGFSPLGNANLMIFNLPYNSPSDVEYRRGVKLISMVYQRAMPEIKSINYFNASVMSGIMKEQNATDILYYHPESIYETSRCNIFMVQSSIVCTPDKGILKGVTRRRIIEMDNKPYQLIEKPITKNELDNADEVFISSTTKGILPVIQIDDKIVGDGIPGPVTKAFSARIISF